jgi:hypothetical protein
LAALYNDVEATLEYKFASAIQNYQYFKTIDRLYPGEWKYGDQLDDAVRTLIHDYRFDTVNLKTNTVYTFCI